MMLLGASSGATNLNEQQRQDILDNIKKIVEKPIEIKKETVQVSYSISKAEEPEMSLHQELAGSISKKGHASTSQKKMSYLQEFDESKKKSHRESKAKIAESIDEDIAIRSHDFTNSRREKGSSADDSIDEDIADEVPTEKEDSISEQIEESGTSYKGTESRLSKVSSQSISQSQSGIFHNSAFDEFKDDKLQEFRRGGKHAGIHQVLGEIEQEVLRHREVREKKLKNDLKKRNISSNAYSRKVRELEKWVTAEKKEIKTVKKNIGDNYRDVDTYLAGLDKDKKSLVDKVGVSPRRSRLSVG
jgi:hypothetical protein